MTEILKTLIEHKGGEVYSVAPTATVTDAVTTMNAHRIGAVLVMEPGASSPTGIFTERDVLQRVINAGRDPDTVSVREVMTSSLVVVGPSTSVEEAMAVVTEKRCRHLPVVDGDQLVGLVSSGDLTRWMIRDQSIHIDHLVSYITDQYPR
jgi:CBS domain-containing protein